MKLLRLIFGVLAISLASCGSDDTPDPEPTPPVTSSERTVLVYMAADNNLNNFSVIDLNEMLTGSKSLSDKQNLVIFVDQKDSKKTPFYMRAKDGKFVDSTSVTDTPSSDPAVLEEALRYVRDKYPAKSYGLVLWGHATGWLFRNDTIVYAKTRAYGLDEGAYPSTWMNIPSMARAIRNGMNGEKLTFIHGDCCNFGTVEVAYELRNVADYIIGSPAEIPDYGNDYTNLSGLFDTSDTFYKKIIDLYWDYYLSEFKNKPNRYYVQEYGDLAGYSVPLMAVKTSELENLASATATLLNTIPDKLKPAGTLNLNNSLSYACNDYLLHNYDMYKTLKDNTSEAAFNDWKPAFEKAVIYNRPSAHWYTTISKLRTAMVNFDEAKSADSHVLAMFFPGNTYKNVYPSWNTTIQRTQWNGPISWQQYGW